MKNSTECKVPENTMRDLKASLSEHCREERKTIEWDRLEISSRKLEISREHFIQDWAP